MFLLSHFRLFLARLLACLLLDRTSEISSSAVFRTLGQIPVPGRNIDTSNNHRLQYDLTVHTTCSRLEVVEKFLQMKWTAHVCLDSQDLAHLGSFQTLTLCFLCGSLAGLFLKRTVTVAE